MIQKALSLSYKYEPFCVIWDLVTYVTICLLTIQPFTLISRINLENSGAWGLWSNYEIRFVSPTEVTQARSCHQRVPSQAMERWLLPETSHQIWRWLSIPRCSQMESRVTVLLTQTAELRKITLRCWSPSYPCTCTGYINFTGPRAAIPKEDFCCYNIIKATQSICFKTQQQVSCV